MATNSHSYQVVFLIDINGENKTHHNISLVVIKLLTRLSHQGHRSRVKWGYRFYDSTKTLVGGKGRPVFHDFGAKEFEKFENELHERLRSYKVKSSTRKCVNKHGAENAAEILQNELKETTEVFSWDMPDITSPSRPTRSTKCKQATDMLQVKKNMVFVLSPCPCSMEELTAFTEVYNDNEEEHFESILPVKVYRSFHEIAKVDLYWVDMQLHTQKEVDYKGIKILDDSLKRVNGSIIPMSALLQVSNANTTNIFTCLQSVPNENKETNLSQVVPVASIVDYYTLYRQYETKTDPGYISLCTDNGNSPTELCKLHIHSTRNVDIPQTKPSNDTKKSRTHGKKKSTSDTTNTPTVITLFAKSSGNPDVIHNMDIKGNKTNVDNPTHKALQFTNLIIKGTVPSDSVKLDQLNTTCSYVVTCPEEEKCDLFSSLVSEMALRNITLITTSGKDAVIPLTFLLQPLTSRSATLTQINTATILVIEKLLTWGLPVTDESKDNEQINMFVEKSIKHLLPRSSRTAEPCESATEVEESSKEAFSGESFQSHFVEPWFDPKPKCTAQLISHLQDGKDSDEMYELYKQLRNYYKSKDPAVRRHQEESVATLQDDKAKTQELNTRDPLPRNSSTGMTVQEARTRHIIEKSREVRLQTKSKSDEFAGLERTRRDNRHKASIKFTSNIDFNTDEELVKHLRESYENCIVYSDADVISCCQMVVCLAVHYMKTKHHATYRGETRKIIEKNLIKTHDEIKEKYGALTIESEKNTRSKETELQVILRYELESSLLDGEENEPNDDWIEQMARMLRAVSLYSDVSFLPNFVQKTLLINYIDTLPKALNGLFDELMLMPPDELIQLLFSPEGDISITAPPSNISTRSEQIFSFPVSDSNSGGPRSSTHRRLVHHPSLSDIGSKRQIVIPGLRKTQATKSKNERMERKERMKATTKPRYVTRGSAKKSAKKTAVLKKKNKEEDTEMTKVRRNLFLRDQTTTPKKTKPVTPNKTAKAVTPKKVATPKKTPKKKSEHKTLVLKTRSVAETPCHKQDIQAILRRKKRISDESKKMFPDGNEALDVDVVEESPEKYVKKTPLIQSSRGTKLIKRHSFYSSGSSSISRNVEKYKSTGLAIAGNQGIISPPKDDLHSIKTPKKSAAFLFSEISCSPSFMMSKRHSPYKGDVQKDLFTTPSKNTRSQVTYTSVITTPTHLKSPKATVTRPFASLFSVPTSVSKPPHVHESPTHIRALSSPTRIKRLSSPTHSKGSPTHSKGFSSPTNVKGFSSPTHIRALSSPTRIKRLLSPTHSKGSPIHSKGFSSPTNVKGFSSPTHTKGSPTHIRGSPTHIKNKARDMLSAFVDMGTPLKNKFEPLPDEDSGMVTPAKFSLARHHDVQSPESTHKININDTPNTVTKQADVTRDKTIPQTCSVGQDNTVTSDDHKTPPVLHKRRRNSSTPASAKRDNLDHWPRRKRRFGDISPHLSPGVDQKKIFTDQSSSTKTTASETVIDEIISTSFTNFSSPKRKVKVRNKVTNSILNSQTFSDASKEGIQMQYNDDDEIILKSPHVINKATCLRDSSLLTNESTSSRKRSILSPPDTKEPSSKRRRTESDNVVNGTIKTDYFSLENDDVFLTDKVASGCNNEASMTPTSVARFRKSRGSMVACKSPHPKVDALRRESFSHKTRSIQSESQLTSANSPLSNTKTPPGGIIQSPVNMCSPAESPVFNKSVTFDNGSIPCDNKDKLTEDRRFSPLSVKGLSALMCSPIVSKDKQSNQKEKPKTRRTLDLTKESY